MDGRKIDLRVSTFPTNRGEKTVLRILDTRSVTLNLEELGFAEVIGTADLFTRLVQAQQKERWFLKEILRKRDGFEP